MTPIHVRPTIVYLSAGVPSTLSYPRQTVYSTDELDTVPELGGKQYLRHLEGGGKKERKPMYDIF